MANHDLAGIRNQLTVMRWRLDAMAGSDDERARHHRERAWQTCDALVLALAKLDLPPGERCEIERELSALRSRLTSVGR